MVEATARYLIIRADASTQIGTGHLMRCLALAQGWRIKGGQVIFIAACASEGLRKRIEDDGFQIVPLLQHYPDSVDWDITSPVLAKHPGAWVVLDGYHFDSAYHLRIKEAGHQLLVIDDMAHLKHYFADLILNQNISAERLTYTCEPNTRLLLGTDYVLLRNEFADWQGWLRKAPKIARKILVTLGGSDPDNQTCKVMRALSMVNVEKLEVTVVVGASNPHVQTLQAEIRQAPGKFRLVRNATDMPELMAWADVAVSAGGSTCWEMAFLGLPAAILILAENQRRGVIGLDQAGAGLNLGWYRDVSELDLSRAVMKFLGSPGHRQAMSRAGQKLVDGNGVARVVAAIGRRTKSKSAYSEDRLHVRRADLQDAELIWHWANESGVRGNSFNQEQIPLNEHFEWFKRKMSSNDTSYWILELDQVPVAQIRYDRVDANTAEISFSVAVDYRGKGLGQSILRLTFGPACQELAVARLRALVFDTNQASGRIFTKAGFKYLGQERIAMRLCYAYELQCPATTGVT